MGDPSDGLLLIPPPIQPEDPDSPPPGSILLDPFGYLSDRINGTTANGRRNKRGKRILVTFWVASPPRVSCFTVHCPGLEPCAFGDMPKVVCVVDDLVLLRIAICPRGEHLDAKNISHFVYQAGTKNKPPSPPSLKLVRKPPDFMIWDGEVTMLRCGDNDGFFLAVLRRAIINRKHADKHFHLHLYKSNTGSWSTKLMHVDWQDFKYFSLNKVISIGGEFGSVGWVDLWRGVLICDLLVDNSTLRYIPLPSPLVPSGYPMYIRNIIVLDGYIKYFEMRNHGQLGSDTGNTFITEGWIAATKKIEISRIGSDGNWEEDCAIKFSEVPVNNPVYAKMLLQEGDDTKLTLMGIHACYPALSLHDRDVVYIMHRPDHRENKACVIALDMRNKTVKDVVDFCSGRPLDYDFTYLQCEISKHLDIWSSTRHVGNAAETRRDGSLGRGQQVVQRATSYHGGD